MNDSYNPKLLPLNREDIDQSYFFNELIDATAKLEVYKEKIRDSKLDSTWFMPTLQQKEALASSKLEGTETTLDNVLSSQVINNDKDKNINEVRNYYSATGYGQDFLSRHDFSNQFFYDIHNVLMKGNVRKPKIVGEYRKTQNYIGKNDSSHSITFIPPSPERVDELMNNLIDYINKPNDDYRPLVRAAIVHAQFETIHPFLDGNGRVGRILIPMYLYYKKQIDTPCFFISEALEIDKMKYYTLLNSIRNNNDWNEWIKFFLKSVINQCDKCINIITKLNKLYDRDMHIACEEIKSSKIVDIINLLYTYPIINSKEILKNVDNISEATVNRYLSILTRKKILFSDNKKKNRTYFYYDLLDILRS